MAYIQQDDEEQQAQAQEPPQPGAPVQTTPGPTGAPAGGAVPPSASGGAKVSAPAKGGGGFADISKYLQKNKPGAVQVAQRVAGGVAQTGQQAKSALSQGQNQFNQQVQANTVGTNEDLVNQAIANPSQVAGDQSKLQEFTKLRDATYQGPTSLQGQQDYAGINQAFQKVKTEAGRQELLAQGQQGKRASAGGRALDQALIQTDKGAKNILSQTQQQYGNLDERLTTANQAASARAAEAQAATAQTRNQTRAALEGAQGKFQQGLTSKLADETQAVQALKQALESGNLTAEQATGSESIQKPPSGIKSTLRTSITLKTQP